MRTADDLSLSSGHGAAVKHRKHVKKEHKAEPVKQRGPAVKPVSTFGDFSFFLRHPAAAVLAAGAENGAPGPGIN